MSSTKKYQMYVGVDIGSETASVVWGETAEQLETAQRIEQTIKGHRDLIKQLTQTGYPAADTLVVMEATSTYWMQLAVRLYKAGFVVSVINPRQAHHFAQAMLRRAKTDALDAHTLAELAIMLQPEGWQPPGEVWEALYQRLVERDSLVEIRQRVRNQRHALRHRHQVDKAVLARQQHLIDTFESHIKTLDKEIQHWLNNSEWAQKADRLQQIKGVGLLTAAWLLVITNGFTTCEDADQLSSYLGLVPHPQHSGKSQHGYIPIGWGGHSRARRVVYQAAVSAARFNSRIKSFYQHLIDRGKPVKVARCAAARKLVHAAFAVAMNPCAPIPA